MGIGMDKATAALVQNELRGLHDIIKQLQAENKILKEELVSFRKGETATIKQCNTKCTSCGKPGATHRITHAFNDEVKMLCCPCYVKWGGGAFCNGIDCTPAFIRACPVIGCKDCPNDCRGQ